MYDFYPHDSFDSYYEEMKMNEIKLYMHKALKILADIHSKGVIHRDIKPLNLLYNRNTQDLTIIDFGRAVVYNKKEKRDTKVGSKFFKAPELLTGYAYYDFGIDVWNLGIIFGSLIFKKYPLFFFRDNKDLLDVVVDVFGFEKLFKFLNKYSVVLSDVKKKKYFGISQQGFQYFVSQKNGNFLDELALDLLDKMLVIDPNDRITAKEALEHDFFKK